MRKTLFAPAFVGVFVLLASSLLFTACELFDPEEDIPSYIYIEDVSLQTESQEGSSLDKISDVWVFVNSDLIGIWELPARIPILSSGNTDIKIRAGIKNNGIAASRVQYPFYLIKDVSMNLTPGQVDTIHPVVEYEDNLDIFIEDFDAVGVQFTVDSESDTSLQLTQDPQLVREGQGSAVIYLDEAHPEFKMDTDEGFDLPKGGTPVYLELDYRTNNHFVVGMIITNPDQTFQQLKIILNPTLQDDGTTMDWNKTYLELTDIVSSNPDAIEFEVYIEMIIDQDFEGNILVPYPVLYLDNFKLVHP